MLFPVRWEMEFGDHSKVRLFNQQIERADISGREFPKPGDFFMENLLRIDSDQALDIAIKQLPPQTQVKSTSILLEDDHDRPVWKIRVWVSRPHRQYEEKEIGEIIISVENGDILKNRLEPSRAL
jgi:hypothetical protein